MAYKDLEFPLGTTVAEKRRYFILSISKSESRIKRLLDLGAPTIILDKEYEMLAEKKEALEHFSKEN
jgi:hypothetical protein